MSNFPYLTPERVRAVCASSKLVKVAPLVGKGVTPAAVAAKRQSANPKSIYAPDLLSRVAECQAKGMTMPQAATHLRLTRYQVREAGMRTGMSWLNRGYTRPPEDMEKRRAEILAVADCQTKGMTRAQTRAALKLPYARIDDLARETGCSWLANTPQPDSASVLVRQWIEKHGFPPCGKELARKLNVSASSVYKMVVKLNRRNAA